MYKRQTDSTSTAFGIEKSMFNVNVDENTIEPVSSDTPIDCNNRQMFLTKSAKESMLIRLNNIESNETCNDNNILSNESNNLFFIESSGKSYLNPRDCCAIESAVKNSGLDGNIIIAMTSPFLDVFANNATCHIYTKYEGKSVFFLYVNVDTIFRHTPIHQLHLDGNLIHPNKRTTIVQYR